MPDIPQASQSCQVLIIGTGFGGLGMAIQLQKNGISDFILLEKADAIGGTWRDNGYPGAACDVPSHLYSYSFEPKTDWSRKFAPQAEIHAYMRHCVDKYGLARHVRLRSEVSSAAFDEAAGLWRVTLGTGEQLAAPVLISACGQLNQPAPVSTGSRARPSTRRAGVTISTFPESGWRLSARALRPSSSYRRSSPRSLSCNCSNARRPMCWPSRIVTTGPGSWR